MMVLSTTCLIALAACVAQDPKPSAPDPQRVLDEIKAQFAKEGIVVDAKAQTVTVPATVNAPQDPIEYLLIHRRGKRHEAMFVVTCKPSVLNGALLAIGLQPGTNATYVEKDPPPTLEQVQNGADPLIVTPPKGAPFWMTVRWKTAEGKVEEHCVEDLLLDLGTQQPVADCSWVYLGGRLARINKDEPEVYVADYEGNLVSVCYLSPDNHLATMVHANARDDQNWWTTALLPPPDTAVEFVFHRTRPELHVARTKRLAQEAAARAKGDSPAPTPTPEAGGERGK